MAQALAPEMVTTPRMRPQGILVLLVLFACLAAPATAAANPRYAGLVIDALTGEVFYSENADRQLYPASLTKMMTLYLTFQALQEGRLTLNQQLVVSATANAQPPSRIDVPTGGTIRVEDAIYALVTKSANNIAVVLAEALSGSESAFASAMTDQAHRLGMTSTTFRNASGLPNSGQRSTARDMARLAQALLRDYPQYYHYFQTQTWAYRGTTYRNHNRLLGVYPGMDGLKTGYIRASGFNLAASAVRGRLRVIAIVFGGRTASSRNEHMVDLLDRAFDSDRGEYLIAHGSMPFDPPIPARRPQEPMQIAALTSAGTVPVAPAAPVVERIGQSVPSGLAAVPQPPGMPAVREPQVATVEPTGLAPLIAASLAEPLPEPPAAPSRVVATLGPASGPPLTLVQQGTQAALPGADPQAEGLWSIQVGAYSSPSDGQQALRDAADRLPDLLRHATVSITPVDTDLGELFRARLGGLDQQTATLACQRLGSGGTPCLAIAPGAAF